MTNEELEKKIEFIVEQQAQLVVNQQKADERMTTLEGLIGRLATASLERFENLESKISALVDAQIKTETTAAETNERLNAFITVVERYITGGQNGRSQE